MICFWLFFFGGWGCFFWGGGVGKGWHGVGWDVKIFDLFWTVLVHKDPVNSSHLSIMATFSVSLQWSQLAGLTVPPKFSAVISSAYSITGMFNVSKIDNGDYILMIIYLSLHLCLQVVGGHPNRRITRFSVKFFILRFSIISIVDIPFNILWNSQFLIWCNFCVIITFIESCHFILS